jgi:hypothetical protein
MFSMGYDQKHFCHGRGRGFEPRRPRHKPKQKGLWQVAKPRSTCEGAKAIGAFLLPAFLPCEGAESIFFFLPASKTIVITLLFASRLSRKLLSINVERDPRICVA